MFRPPSRHNDDGRPFPFAFPPAYPEGSEGALLLATPHEEVRAEAEAISRRSSQEFAASEQRARELFVERGGVPPKSTPRPDPPQHEPLEGWADLPA